MRDYAKVSPQFWTGKTGKSLRGNREAQLVALYLLTSPHSNMIGVFTLPVLYIAHETGLTLEGARKGLARCIQAGFCTYDEEAEQVFVVEMAAHQVGEDLKPSDNRITGIRKQFAQMPEGPIKSAFHARYMAAFGLPFAERRARDLEAPSEPLASQKTETEQEQEKNNLSSSAAPNDAKPAGDLQTRISQITDDAIAAFNASPLVKPNGGLLATVSTTVGREKRREQVKRCLRTARAICLETYGSQTITPEFWADYFAAVAEDEFLSGRQGGGKGHERWLPDFEFLTREAQMLKVYDRTAGEDAA